MIKITRIRKRYTLLAALLIMLTPLQTASALSTDDITFWHDSVGGKRYSSQANSIQPFLANGISASWSHDGAQVAYLDATDSQTLVIANSDGETLHEVNLGGAINTYYIEWSPSDEYIALGDSGNKLYVYSLFAEELYEMPTLNTGSAPVKDGMRWGTYTNKIYYTANTLNNFGKEIVAIHPDGSGFEVIVDSPYDITSFDIDPRNGNIAYTEGSRVKLFDISDQTTTTLVDKTAESTVIRGDIRWSPNTLHLIYSEHDQHQNRRIMELDVTNQPYTPTEAVNTGSTSGSIRHIAPVPTSNQYSLYSASVSNVQVNNAQGKVTYDIHLRANSVDSLNTPLSLHSNITGQSGLDINNKQPAAFTFTSVGEEKTLSITQDIPFTGESTVTCYIASNSSAFLSQPCAEFTINYTGNVLPIYRFWSTKNNHHFYTSNYNEATSVIENYSDDIWQYEAAAFKVSSSVAGECPAGKSPVYRFWSNKYQGHFYTISTAEKDSVIAKWPTIWNFEGVVFCANTSASGEFTSPVYRFWSDKYQGHFYTTNSAERDSVIQTWPGIWKYEGPVYYVAS